MIYRNIFKQLRKNSVAKSFASLSFWQITNYLIPLIAMPYLIRIIGTEKFGVVSLIQAIQYYFIILVDYGFNTTGVKEISVSRHDKVSISIICSKILFSKLFLTLISLCILILLLLFVPKLGNEWKAYLLGFSIVIGQALFPIWYFQGIENMKFITYLNLVSKLIFIGCVFLFIKEKSDYIYFILFQGMGLILASLVALGLITYNFKIHITFPGWRSIIFHIKDSYSIFVSNFSVTAYNSSNYLILSFFGDDRILGMYSIAEKIMSLLRQLLAMFSQAVFPKVCWLVTESHLELRKFWRRTAIPFGILVFLSCATVSTFSTFIVSLLSHENIEETARLLSIIAWLPLIVFCNIPFFQTLMAYNLKKEIMQVLVVSSSFCIATSLYLTSHFSATGSIISLLVTEFLIVIGLLITLEKRKSISIL